MSESLIGKRVRVSIPGRPKFIGVVKAKMGYGFIVVATHNEYFVAADEITPIGEEG